MDVVYPESERRLDVLESAAITAVDLKSGATLWTNARYGEWPVAKVRTGAGEPVLFSVSDPRDRYAESMAELIGVVADDFGVHYERRPAAKQ